MKRFLQAAMAVVMVAVPVALPATQSQARPPATDGGGGHGHGGIRAHVMAAHIYPDGSGWATLYEPADGVSREALYSELKAAGVPDLVDPSAKASVALDPQQCYHNTAFAWRNGFCPPITWTYQGHPRPIVYFRDYTGILWPVSSATQTWNQSIAIDSYWTDAGCPSNVHCVPVREGNYGSTGFCGQASLSWDAAGHFIDGQVSVRLNNQAFDAGRCSAGRRSTACHELGHVLGLDHNTSTTSCLYPTSVSGRSTTPNSDDFWVLANISY